VADGFWRFYSKANRVVRTFTGPAQLGAGHPEAPDVRSTETACPICGAPMSAHEVIRNGGQRESTRLYCPA
jgi:hypothetical protein